MVNRAMQSNRRTSRSISGTSQDPKDRREWSFVVVSDRIQIARSSHQTVGRGGSVKKRWAGLRIEILGPLLKQLREAAAGLANEGQDARGMNGNVDANMATNRLRLDLRETAPLAHPSDLHRLIVKRDGVLQLVPLVLHQLHAGQPAGGRVRSELEAEVCG